MTPLKYWMLVLSLGMVTTVTFAEDDTIAAAEPAVIEPATSVVPPSRVSADQLLLDSTSVRGNQELPRVMYIVPWKDPRLGDAVGKPVNSLIDEVLAPVDRDVFRRQTKYFDQLYGSDE